jgi:N6-adenosine-specific RNA methylase IME4
MSDGRYKTIVADPPWPHEGFATSPGDPKRGRERKILPSEMPYGGMGVEEICALPVRRLADTSARLFLWTTNKFLPDAFRVLGEWGFGYRQTLIWHKTGNPSPFGGSVAPIHAEFLLVAACGSPNSTGRLDSSIVAAPKPYEHSRKPDVFLDLIERVSPGPYLELFARRARFGWDYSGRREPRDSRDAGVRVTGVRP